MTEFVNPKIQAMNLIREIGDKVSQSGEPIDQLSDGDRFTVQLIEELIDHGVIKSSDPVSFLNGSTAFMGVNLTLEGWEQYEAEKRGQISGNYGFIAMQFGDDELDPFVSDVVKPAIKEKLGYDLIDMRDIAEAGIIDNIMRVRIRDAAFVVADLTHDNRGAYWEAGYAEGLGKPVVYICERTKFEKENSHFDTNHCTTVPWSKDEPEKFSRELIATLRRSLDHSP